MTDVSKDYSALFTPLEFSNGVIARNRIAMAPMTHYSSLQDGHSIPDEAQYYRRRCKGVGVAFTASYSVSINGRICFGEPFIMDDSFIPDATEIATAMKSGGALAIIQLHHAGCVAQPKVVPNGDVVGPTSFGTPKRAKTTPRELTPEEIDKLVDDFGQATLRAIKAGFDGVALHGAFGYLFQQFISPYTNRREDKWGGTQEKRFAFPLAVIKEVQRIVSLYGNKSFLIGYRFTPEEEFRPGLTMADALALTEALVSSGLHFIDVLVNNYRSPARDGVEDLKSPRLALVKKQIAGRTLLMGGGAIFSPEEGIEALKIGVDMITLARAMIMDPEWVQKVEEGRENEIVKIMRKNTREELEMPEGLWDEIWSTPGWFPGTLPEVKAS